MRTSALSKVETVGGEIEAAWSVIQSNVLLTSLDLGDKFNKIVPYLPTFKAAFRGKPRAIICSDDRVNLDIDPTLDFAGQLIFATDKELEEFTAKYHNQVDLVFSHSGCGAAKRMLEVIGGEGGYEFSDRLSMTHSQRLARMLGPQTKDDHIFIGGPHKARMIILDGTARFNPYVIPAMPQAFKCSAPGCGLPERYIARELKFLLSVAFNREHSIGAYLSHRHPFYVIVIAEDGCQLVWLQSLAEEIAKDYGKRVRVDGVNVSGMFSA